MDIRTLYTLIAIADRGSFAEAGNSIGLSLSAVSMQVRMLEEELEITIFDRSRRPREVRPAADGGGPVQRQGQ